LTQDVHAVFGFGVKTTQMLLKASVLYLNKG
jgi:hypothetical protein